MSLTPSQNEAIGARGNLLLVAGAGTGKTTTLVERCLHCLLEESPPASLEEILMVTFTDAAAAEMRQRIRERLEQKLAAQANDLRWSEQLALFDTAHLGTLHSFCLQLVRRHFYELELDPQLTVMPEEEARFLAEETLDAILQRHYAGRNETDEAVQELIRTQARGWDQPIRELVLRLHHYTQTLRDPEGWFASQLALFQSAEPRQWGAWLLEGVRDWRDRWLPVLQRESAENEKASACAAKLKRLPKKPSREQCAAALEQIISEDDDWPSRKKTVLRKPLAGLFDEAAFLGSLAKSSGRSEPLAEDWKWVHAQMAALLELAREFTAAFSREKRELGMVDFHDLEQHALRLLWDRAANQPTPAARHWRDKFRFIFVDEYQDINEAQDAILKALSREGPAANRFLVGDVKQSIYRFRLADPRIFQTYLETWRGGEGRVIPLVENFRSRESILQFVNSLFGALMRREIGGVPYDDEARLRFGDPEGRAPLSLAHDASPRVELHLRLKGAGNSSGSERDNEDLIEMQNLEEAGKEARLVALRLRELKKKGELVWDESLKAMRPVQWRDMAVLLRSPSGKAESYAKEFSRLDIPLLVARGGFYESMEVADLLSLLQVLDNPLQDLPVIAVLHSPLVGLSLDDLAAIRLVLPKGHFWTALQRFHESNPKHPGWAKAGRFLKNFAAWRRLARQVSLSRCLEAVLDETHYADWLLTRLRGEQRHANVRRLLALAQQFDQFQRKGLFRFLRFIEAQRAAETEPDVAPVAGGDSVSLMSIHQSKGLEFPVVVVADLGKPFNLSDLRAEIILDDQFGLCPHIKPPQTGRSYPSLPYWLARQRQRQESMGEEMRLLYVAMTRARDLLILSGGIAEKKFDRHWRETASLETASLLAAGNYLDWIGAWSLESAGAFPSAAAGENSFWRWTIYDAFDQRLADKSTQPSTGEQPESALPQLDEDGARDLHERLAWQYPHTAATTQAAKLSVTALRRSLADESEAETKPLYRLPITNFKSRLRGQAGTAETLSASEIGTAHHTFLQLASLERVGSAEALRAEARRLLQAGSLTEPQFAALDFEALADFWQSDPGKQILARAGDVRRELAFTARFSPDELAEFGDGLAGLPDSEFVVVQGIADLVVLLPEEIWLLDFKTDQLKAEELPARARLYEPQLRLYASALSRIFRRPVTRAQLQFLALRRAVAVETSPASVQRRP